MSSLLCLKLECVGITPIFVRYSSILPLRNRLSFKSGEISLYEYEPGKGAIANSDSADVLCFHIATYFHISSCTQRGRQNYSLVIILYISLQSLSPVVEPKAPSAILLGVLLAFHFRRCRLNVYFAYAITYGGQILNKAVLIYPRGCYIALEAYSANCPNKEGRNWWALRYFRIDNL